MDEYDPCSDPERIQLQIRAALANVRFRIAESMDPCLRSQAEARWHQLVAEVEGQVRAAAWAASEARNGTKH